MRLPEGDGVVQPALRRRARAQAKAVAEAGIDVQLGGNPQRLHARKAALHDAPARNPVPSPTQAKVGGPACEYSLSPVYCVTTVAGRGSSPPPKAAAPYAPTHADMRPPAEPPQREYPSTSTSSSSA